MEIVMDNNEYGQSPIVFNHHKIKLKIKKTEVYVANFEATF